MEQKILSKSDIRFELVRQLSRAVSNRDIAGGLRLAEKSAGSFTECEHPVGGEFRCLEASLFYLSGDYRRALASARMAATLLSSWGESGKLAEAFAICGKALIGMGNYPEAETALIDAESLFRRNEDLNGRIEAVNQLARIYFIRAEYKNSMKRLLEAVRLADQLGDRRQLSFLWGNLGRVYTFLGEFKKASDSLTLNVEISDELNDRREKAKALLSLGFITMKSRQLDEAQAYFDEAYLILIREKMNRDAIICQTYYGELYRLQGKFSVARRSLNEAIDNARRIAPESSLLVSPLRQLAELELAENHPGAASRLAHRALALAKSINDVNEKGSLIRLLGRLASQSKQDKHKAEAVSLLQEAMAIFEETGSRFEKAETLLELADSGLVDRRRRLSCLFRAADIFKRLGNRKRHHAVQGLIGESESVTTESPEATGRQIAEGPTIITGNARMKRILSQLSQASRSEIPVLLSGATGTGKDLLARHYHLGSGRTGEFVAVNCAAFPETLLEAELFGYRKGAFTGAVGDKEGLLHRANGGTFFFDEIGEMSLASQAKLLTVIETRRTRRLGSVSEEKLDVRFVAATNCDLPEMVAQGKFRRDLYYRLSGICFEIPSLDDRPEDIPLLLEHFLRLESVLCEGSRVDPELIREFTSRSWPGNIRQLESEVKKLALFRTMARDDSLGEMAGILIDDDGDAETASLVLQVEQFEKTLIIRALRRAEGNKSQAARTLSIHESTLRAKMKRYDLQIATAS